MTRVGFIGLGNVGGKLAGSLLRNGIDLVIRDLDRAVAQPFIDAGASWGESPAAMARDCDIIITCLPSPAASAAVMEADDGILSGLSEGKIWAEMSTTDEAEIVRLAAHVAERVRQRLIVRYREAATALPPATSPSLLVVSALCLTACCRF